MENEKHLNEDWHPKPIREQVEILAKEFDLCSKATLRFLDTSFQELDLPSCAQGWFALPTIDAVTEQFFPTLSKAIEKYRRSTELALDKISATFSEFGDLDCKSTPEKFFLPERTRRALEVIRAHQIGSILVIPVGFNTKVSGDDQFSLGSFFTACLALTHPERYPASRKPQESSESGVECIGFGSVRCHTCWFDDARVKWNQAVGFIPRFTAGNP